MYDHDSKGISYTAGFFMLIAFAVAAMLLSVPVVQVIWTQMTGKTVTILTNGTYGPEDGTALKVIQAISAIIGFLLPTVITAIVLNRRPGKLLGFSTRFSMSQVGLVFLIMGSAIVVAGGLAYFNNHIPVPAKWKIDFEKLEAEYNRQAAAIISLKNTGEYVLALIVMGFIPAFCEETLFRGGLQNFLTRGTNNPLLAIVVASVIFSLAHLSFYLFLSRFFLGAVLGLIYYYSGRLWLSILAHFLNNAAAVTLFYIQMKGGKSLSEIMNQGTESFWGLAALPVVIILFMAFKKNSVKSRAA